MTARGGDACCFSGHRPEKLPWRDDERDDRCIMLKEIITDAVRSVYQGGIRHFICGMARGCDMYFAEAVITLRDECPGIFLEAAVPCETQPDGWPEEERERYFYILHQCDKQTLISRAYTPECMLRRNRYMVDSSRVLIAACEEGGPTRGGTAQTLHYAQTQGLRIIKIPIPV